MEKLKRNMERLSECINLMNDEDDDIAMLNEKMSEMLLILNIEHDDVKDNDEMMEECRLDKFMREIAIPLYFIYCGESNV